MASKRMPESASIASDVVRREMKALLRLPGFEFVKQNPFSYYSRTPIFKVLHANLRYEEECGRRRPREAEVASRITVLVNACVDGFVELQKQHPDEDTDQIGSHLMAHDFWYRAAKSLNCYRDGKLDAFIMGRDARVIMITYVSAQALADKNQEMVKEPQWAQDDIPVQYTPELQALHDALRKWRNMTPDSYLDTRRYRLWEEFPAQATDDTSQPDATGDISQHHSTGSISQLDAMDSDTNAEMISPQHLAEDLNTLKKQLEDAQSHLMAVKEQNKSLSEAYETLMDKYYHANDHYELWFEKPWLDFITVANPRRVASQMAELGGGDLKKFLREQWPHDYPKDN
ncbi:hypothetical protein SUNI508_10112 [Seiridium unicorne]|uniref:Uncharacterized protein n=1 Tax=Seiridium unicorne TaxID=138068 RepID=A0ABR2UMM0_9PEZI